MKLEIETTLLRLAEKSGDPNTTRVLELAARIVAENARQASALTAARDLLAEIEAGTCDQPAYEAGTWRRIYAPNHSPANVKDLA